MALWCGLGFKGPGLPGIWVHLGFMCSMVQELSRDCLKDESDREL